MPGENHLTDGLGEALGFIVSGDPEIRAISLLTLEVAVASVLIAAAIGLPCAMALSYERFRGQRLLLAVANALMGLPPVVVGLGVVMLLWRTGPLGAWDVLFTPQAMIIAQTLLALPFVIALSATAYSGIEPRLRLQLKSMGATPFQEMALLTREARLGILASLVAALGQVFSEVGAVMMVGGNIRGETRVLTTAIVLETRQGNFSTATALSFILLGLIFLTTALLTWIQFRRRP